MQKKLFQKEQLKKTAEETGDLIGNKIADKITSFSKKSPKELHPQNDDKIKIPKERYISQFTLCDYSDLYILVKGTITITGAVDDAAAR